MVVWTTRRACLGASGRTVASRGARPSERSTLASQGRPEPRRRRRPRARPRLAIREPACCRGRSDPGGFAGQSLRTQYATGAVIDGGGREERGSTITCEISRPRVVPAWTARPGRRRAPARRARGAAWRRWARPTISTRPPRRRDQERDGRPVIRRRGRQGAADCGRRSSIRTCRGAAAPGSLWAAAMAMADTMSRTGRGRLADAVWPHESGHPDVDVRHECAKPAALRARGERNARTVTRLAGYARSRRRTRRSPERVADYSALAEPKATDRFW